MVLWMFECLDLVVLSREFVAGLFDESPTCPGAWRNRLGERGTLSPEAPSHHDYLAPQSSRHRHHRRRVPSSRSILPKTGSVAPVHRRFWNVFSHWGFFRAPPFLGSLAPFPWPWWQYFIRSLKLSRRSGCCVFFSCRISRTSSWFLPRKCDISMCSLPMFAPSPCFPGAHLASSLAATRLRCCGVKTFKVPLNQVRMSKVEYIPALVGPKP